MKDDTLAHLHDLLHAGNDINTFVADRTFDDYESDNLLRSAVERKFEIMGEALTRIRKDDEQVLAKIRDHRDIISFRNILIHGYDAIDNRIVRGVIKEEPRQPTRGRYPPAPLTDQRVEQGSGGYRQRHNTVKPL
jgi:uncharacterized protein with HEPN domain